MPTLDIDASLPSQFHYQGGCASINQNIIPPKQNIKNTKFPDVSQSIAMLYKSTALIQKVFGKLSVFCEDQFWQLLCSKYPH